MPGEPLRASRRPRELVLLILAALLAAGALLPALFAPGPVLTAWLPAAWFLLGVPTGTLVLALMMRLIPGAWGEELRLSAEAATLLTLPALVALLPILLALAAVYPWAGAGPASLSPFQQAWLAPVPFAARTLVHGALLLWLGARLRARRSTRATAAIGVVVLPLTTSALAYDWLLSLDPGFGSSAFGLRQLALQVTIAFAAMLLLRLGSGRTPKRPGVLGALLLTLLLINVYLMFLPFFIIWSGNLATEVPWYAARGRGGWAAAVWVFGLTGGLPILPLLFARVRRSARWLRGLSLAVLLAAAIELGWTVLPGRGTPLLCLVAFAAVTCFLAAALPVALRYRIARRMPSQRHT